VLLIIVYVRQLIVIVNSLLILCLTGRRPLTRKRSQDATKSSQCTDTMHQSAATAAATPSSLGHGLSLRSQVHAAGEVSQAARQNESESSWEFPQQSEALQSSTGRVMQHTSSAETGSRNIHVGQRRRLGMTSRTMRPPTVAARPPVTATRPPSVAKRHCQHLDDVAVGVNSCDVHIQPKTDHEFSTCTAAGRSPSMLNESFKKLVVGLHRISPCHQVDGKRAAQSDTLQIPQSLLRQSSMHRKRTRGRSRKKDQDHGKPCSSSDAVDGEDLDDRPQLKDCVVVLERSHDIDKMLKHTQICYLEATESSPVTGTEVSSHAAVPCQSHQITTSSSPLLSSVASASSSSSLSSVARSDKLHHKLSLRRNAKTSSSQKSMQLPCKSSSQYMNVCSNDPHDVRNLNTVSHQNSRLSDTSADVGDVSIGSREDVQHLSSEIAVAARRRLKRRKVCLELTRSHDGLGTEEVIVGQGRTDLDPGTDDRAVVGKTEVVLPRPDPDLSSPTHMRSSTITDELSNAAVTSQPDPDLSYVAQLKNEAGLQPDPDFSSLFMTVKHTDTTIVTSSEADIGQSEVMPQLDPDSQQPVDTVDLTDDNGAVVGQTEVKSQPDPNLTSLVKTAVVEHAAISQSEVISQPDPDLSSLTPEKCIITIDDETDVGQTEVMSQPDPVIRQPPEAADFSLDRCTDSMYRMALFSSPETSDLDSSPPFPFSPTESLSCESQTSTGQQTTLYQHPDDNDVVDDNFGYLSDIKATLSQTVGSRIGRLEVDVVRPASSVVTSSSAENKSKDKNDAQEIGPDAEESGMIMAGNVEESSSQSENVEFDLVGHMNVRKKDVSPTPSYDKSVTVANYDESSSQSRNVDSPAAAHSDVRNNYIGSTLGDKISPEESVALIDSSNRSLSSSKNVTFNLTERAESVGDRNNKIGSTPNERSHDVSVDSSAELVVLCPENLPPSRHQVIFDLASSSRSTLLQSSLDAFSTDSTDLLSHQRYVLRKAKGRSILVGREWATGRQY